MMLDGFPVGTNRGRSKILGLNGQQVVAPYGARCYLGRPPTNLGQGPPGSFVKQESLVCFLCPKGQTPVHFTWVPYHESSSKPPYPTSCDGGHKPSAPPLPLLSG